MRVRGTGIKETGTNALTKAAEDTRALAIVKNVATALTKPGRQSNPRSKLEAVWELTDAAVVHTAVLAQEVGVTALGDECACQNSLLLRPV